MSHSSTPHWHEPNDVVRTIRTAKRKQSVSDDRLVEVLDNHELDAPRDRIEQLVEATPTQFPSAESDSVELDEPRSLQTRFVDADDIACLSAKEFATILGAALSRYEGQFRTPDNVDELDIDLFWNRQHTTVALRTVPRKSGRHVDEDTVKHVVRGKTSTPSGRSPSVVGVVTNERFTDSAENLAEKGDLKLFGREFLSQWLRGAQITPEVVGKLLDEGERGSSEIESLLDELPELPDAVRDREVLFDDEHGIRLEPSMSGEEHGDGSTETPTRSAPTVGTPSTPGQRGELYADPEEDGDFGAFDDFMEELDTEDDSQ